MKPAEENTNPVIVQATMNGKTELAKKNQNPSGDNAPDALKIVVLETLSTVTEPVVKAKTQIKPLLPL